MTSPSREHSSDEFGQPPSRGIKGLDAPMVGAPVNITLDGIVERESGVTPPPPAISVQAVAITLAAMFILGLILWFLLAQFAPPPPSSDPEESESVVPGRVEQARQPDAFRVFALR